jgi:hypothetical protein
LQAFDRLRELGIIQPLHPDSKSKLNATGVFQVCQLMPFPHVIDDLAKQLKELPETLRRFCKNREV